jgi:hypothetical protein
MGYGVIYFLGEVARDPPWGCLFCYFFCGPQKSEKQKPVVPLHSRVSDCCGWPCIHLNTYIPHIGDTRYFSFFFFIVWCTLLFAAYLPALLSSPRCMKSKFHSRMGVLLDEHTNDLESLRCCTRRPGGKYRLFRCPRPVVAASRATTASNAALRWIES